MGPEDLLMQPPPLADGSALGWSGFLELEFIAEMAMVLGLAVVLAAAIAYHPILRRRATTLEELEQPKTFILYAMIGALIAIIVKVQPSMALVVFGIGGLMRFRTDVGQAKDTGRVILVTVVGLSCGLELYVVAVLTTLLAWILIVLLDSRPVERLFVQGLDKERVQAASEVYGGLLRELGCRVVGEEKRVHKGSFALLYRAPRGVSRDRILARIGELPERERGAASWE